MKDEISILIEKAKRSLEAAKSLYEREDYDFAVSRAYYAIFYISEALLLKKGKSYSKHTAVITAIYNEYIAAKILPKEFHQILHRAFDLRQEGDYLISTEVTKEVADQLIRDIGFQLNNTIKTFP